MEERTLSTALLLGNDTEQGCIQLDDVRTGTRPDTSLERRILLTLLDPGDIWQPGEGAWYIFSTT